MLDAVRARKKKQGNTGQKKDLSVTAWLISCGDGKSEEKVIRNAAAKELARLLLADRLTDGTLSETGIELAASIIQNAVMNDEILQQVEKNRKTLQLVEKA